MEESWGDNQGSSRSSEVGKAARLGETEAVTRAGRPAGDFGMRRDQRQSVVCAI